MELLKKLNCAQQKAVTTTEGFVRVIAGAGSGKTRALSHRFAFLVNELGILPGNILCITFTNKSANEMRQRIHTLTGDHDTGYINTFHGFCVSILQEDSYAVQYPKSFLVLDNADIDSMLQIIYEERGLTLKDMTFANAREMIENRKLCKEPDYYQLMISLSLNDLKERYLTSTKAEDVIFYGYLYQEKKCFGLDYNDLIKFTLYIFDHFPEIRRKWQQRLEYIMIDEFQDIDELQYQLMEVLCDYHKNLFIVGDPDQTIYTWRGANVKYLLDFDKAFPNVKTIMMMENYRSTPEILAVANSLITKNNHRIPKELISMLPSGGPVTCHYADTTEKECQWIASKIRALHDEGTSYREMAVLYRAHYVTRAVEAALLKEKIPYAIFSGVQFFGRTEIKDTLSYLRMVALKDDFSFLRTVNMPKRNLGKRRIAFLQEYAAEHQCSLYDALIATLDNPIFRGTKASAYVDLIQSFAGSYDKCSVSELLDDLLKESGYEKMLRTEGSQERLDNLAELKQSVREYEITCGEEYTVEHYLAHVALFSNSDADAGKEDKVKLMTVHSAKGLEFPHVFLCGMNEGIFPSRKIHSIESMEEERRLAFVAITRAEKALYLTESYGRNFDGSPRYPSRFLVDIDQSLLASSGGYPETLLEETRKYVDTTSSYLYNQDDSKVLPVGQRIQHFIFGTGTILGVDLHMSAHIVQFDDMETPRKVSFRATLEKI